MSASTRPVQRTLGIGQLGGMLVLLAVMAAIVAAVAIASLASTKAKVTPAAAGFPPPAVIDHGSRDEMSSGAKDSGLSYWQPDRRGGLEYVPGSAAKDSGLSYWQPDRRGGIEFVPGHVTGGSGGFGGFGGPRLGSDEPAVDSNAGAGGNGPRLRPQ